MRDRDIVAAIIAADPAGLSAAYDRYAVSLYTYCRCLLSEPADVADAVQDTFIIAAAKLSALRDPDRLRPWLYAVARNECRRRVRSTPPAVPLDEAAEVTGDTADLGTSLEQAELREVVWSALAGLSTSEREIIELSLGHELAGPDLAGALGVPRNQAHAMASRARAHFESALGVLLVARTGRDACTELDAMLDGWDGELTVLLRKRVGRHIRRCAICGHRKRTELDPDVLFGLLPVAVLPASLRPRVLGLVTDPSPASAAQRTAIGQRAEPLGPGGFPQPIDPPAPVRFYHVAAHHLAQHPVLTRQHVRAGAAAAGSAAIIGGALLAGGLPGHQHTGPASGALPRPSVSSEAAAAPAAPAAAGQPSSGHRGRLAGTGGPGTAAPGPGGSSPGSPPAPTSPSGSSSPVGAVVTGKLSVSPARLGLGLSLGGSWTGTLKLTATNGPVTYHLTVPPSLLGDVTVSPSSGSLAAGQSAHIKVTAAGGALLSTSAIKVHPGGRRVAIFYQIGV